jgi:hypothetical protein
LGFVQGFGAAVGGCGGGGDANKHTENSTRSILKKSF